MCCASGLQFYWKYGSRKTSIYRQPVGLVRRQLRKWVSQSEKEEQEKEREKAAKDQ